ncbi:hypothetical protein EAX61_09575 [Dokdonia sinensis]|uniref:Toxin-antitoxin system YwqK family antitoxin n=1 Tax=Dokdonia sinensis TaxID=2479847 RepID=A0A3M0G814_9FLAO|nr:hypothetical protein [Dokdonia sinensis]RMB58542.1 hypothetical protein EAX61_09575 [Dokdonia sinensis]
MLIKLLTLFFLFSAPVLDGGSKSYEKLYDDAGNITAEGWKMGEMRVKYWKFYHPNGQVASKGHYEKNRKNEYWYYYNPEGKIIKEGHYDKGTAENWWIFYDLATREKRKVQFKNGLRNGFCLVYKNGSLKQVERYKNDKKNGVWNDVTSFKRDNPDVSF